MRDTAHYPIEPEPTDSAMALRQGWADINEQRPDDHSDALAWQIHALRGTIMQAAEAIICAYQEERRG